MPLTTITIFKNLQNSNYKADYYLMTEKFITLNAINKQNSIKIKFAIKAVIRKTINFTSYALDIHKNFMTIALR